MDGPHRCVALRPVGASTEAGREGRGLIWDEDMESSRSQAGVPRRKGKDEAAQVLLSVGETGCLQNSIRAQGWLSIRGVESASVRPRAHSDGVVPSWVLLPQPCRRRTVSHSSGRWDQ